MKNEFRNKRFDRAFGSLKLEKLLDNCGQKSKYDPLLTECSARTDFFSAILLGI